MPDNVAVQFIRSSSPYEAGDIAGFPPPQAQSLVDRGIAAFWPAKPAAATPVDQFAGMNRAALIAFAHDHLGMAEDPPAEVTDDQLREALRKGGVTQAAAPASSVAPTDPAPAGDQGAAPTAPAADGTKPAKASKAS